MEARNGNWHWHYSKNGVFGIKKMLFSKVMVRKQSEGANMQINTGCNAGRVSTTARYLVV